MVKYQHKHRSLFDLIQLNLGQKWFLFLFLFDYFSHSNCCLFFFNRFFLIKKIAARFFSSVVFMVENVDNNTTQLKLCPKKLFWCFSLPRFLLSNHTSSHTQKRKKKGLNFCLLLTGNQINKKIN